MDCSARPEITKDAIRKQVWDYLENNNLALFPRPVHGRIPNFKGCEAAAHKLAEMDEFRSASCIKVCPDKPQEGVRRFALQSKKELIMPIPRLRSGLFVKLNAQNLKNNEIKYASTARGAKDLGMAIGVDAVISIELIVMGSVAVSHQGYRIGKGEGFADLEYAILMEMKAIHERVPVVTTVHDCQVFEDLPQNLFKEHDVLVDIIVTPTRVLQTSATTTGLPRPIGIIWNLLSQKQVADMPILNILRRKHMADGRNCTLKKIPSQFSLRLSNFPKTTRVRDLKELLASKGIKPSFITWQGFAGSAILHYEDHIHGTKQVEFDFVYSVLKDMKIKGQLLVVEVESADRE